MRPSPNKNVLNWYWSYKLPKLMSSCSVLCVHSLRKEGEKNAITIYDKC